MSYFLYFVNRKSGIEQEDPCGRTDTLIKARRYATMILKETERTAIAIYESTYGMQTYVGKVQYEGDGYFFHAYSGKKWRIHTDGKIVKLKKKAAPFGL